MKSEWTKYAVDKSAIDDEWSDLCRRFDRVAHISHVSPALGILETKKIRAQLVYDESKLNSKRTLVVWVSPNFWGNGFRYGNIQFTFDINQLIHGRKFYWVEIHKYKIPACRILITHQEHPDLAPYDPFLGDGPWWLNEATGNHYYYNKICLELMIEDDLRITIDTPIDYVRHHPEWCSLYRYSPQSCRQLGMGEIQASQLYLASILGRNVAIDAANFGDLTDNGLPNKLSYALSWLSMELAPLSESVNFSGTITWDADLAQPVVRAICNAYTNGLIEEVDRLSSLFASATDLRAALDALVKGHIETY